MRVNSSAFTDQTVNQITRTNAAIFRSLQKLSSGRRMETAVEDPSALIISEQLKSQIGALNQQLRNASSQQSRYRAADATMTNLRSQLTELRATILSASNTGLNSEATQAALDAQARDLAGVYNYTVENWEYNGFKQLDGSEGAVANISQLEGIDLSSPGAVAESLQAVDQAIAGLDSELVRVGAYQSQTLESEQAHLAIAKQNLVAAESIIADIDFGEELSIFLQNILQRDFQLAVLSHSFEIDAIALDFFD